MCGIAGIYGLNDQSRSGQMIARMNDRMAHRGPDDHGIYTDHQVALGHRRLAILDLSPAGHQPMFADNGNLVLVFNGEIYNFREVRESFEGFNYTTSTDSEVILEAFRRHGKNCVHLFNGMFAFAIWDKTKQELFIARDRLGIKPLYYVEAEGLFLFSSEIRSLLASDVVPRRINKSAIAEYFTYQTVHAPDTILDGVKMLMPGHHITISGSIRAVEQYWHPVKNASNDSEGKKYDEVCHDIKMLFEASVKRRLISDVPFGAFLSGGIDSSAVVGQMSRVLEKPVKTFHISFDESEFGEAKYARIIANLYKTEHHELLLTPADFLKMLPEALKAIDHPSGDGPNSYVVSKVTRDYGITMALSGLGGDELFAGYPVFKRVMKVMRNSWIWSLPLPLRKMAGNAFAGMKPGIQGLKIRQLLSMPEVNPGNLQILSRQTQTPDEIAKLFNFEPPADKLYPALDEMIGKAGKLGALSQVGIAEIVTYMQNILLRDTDQMSMASALEVRVPFLDYKLVEYVLGVGDAFKNTVYPKKLLTDSLSDLVPSEIVHRKKMGFSFPWKHWMKGELKQFCDERIRSLAARSFINGKVLTETWRKFLSDDPRVRWHDLWIAVVLENWMQENNIEN